MQDTPTQIPSSWGFHEELINEATTNAVVINQPMYFTITAHPFSLDLSPIYSHYLTDNKDKSQTAPMIQPDILLPHSADVLDQIVLRQVKPKNI